VGLGFFYYFIFIVFLHGGAGPQGFLKSRSVPRRYTIFGPVLSKNQLKSGIFVVGWGRVCWFLPTPTSGERSEVLVSISLYLSLCSNLEQQKVNHLFL